MLEQELFAKFLITERFKRGMTRQAFARVCGVRPNTIAVIENKVASTTIKTMFKILNGLEIGLTELDKSFQEMR